MRLAGKDLRRVRAAARRLERARAALRDAVYAAHLSGESYREIEPHAGISHSKVQQLVKEAERLQADQEE